MKTPNPLRPLPSGSNHTELPAAFFAGRRGDHLLLCNSDPRVLLEVGGALRKRGYRVTTTLSSLQATRRMKSQWFDLALLDVETLARGGHGALARLFRLGGLRTPTLLLGKDAPGWSATSPSATRLLTHVGRRGLLPVEPPPPPPPACGLPAGALLAAT